MDAPLREQRGDVFVYVDRADLVSVIANHPARHVSLDAVHEVRCSRVLVYGQHGAASHPYHRDADAGAYKCGELGHVDGRHSVLAVVVVGVLARVVPPGGILVEELLSVIPCSGSL